MTNLVLLRAIKNFRTPFLISRLYHVGKASSVNTAIARGLRKSKNLGFRGKEKSSENDPREKYIARNGLPRWTSEPARISTSGPQMTRDGWEGRSKREPVQPDFRIRRGKKEVKVETGRGLQPFKNDRTGSGFGGRERGSRHPENRDRFSASESGPSRGFDKPSFRRRRNDEDPNNGRPAYLPRDSERNSSRRGWDRSAQEDVFESKPPNRPIRSHNRIIKSQDVYPSSSNKKSSFESRSRESNSTDRYTGRNSSRQHESESAEQSGRSNNRLSMHRKPQETTGKRHEDPSRSTFTQTTDNRIPLSIPYTTPASEFLYGTSVVEAALSSRRVPRRKHYKLYIYKGENRENIDQDEKLKKLARKNGVEVVQVGGDGLRLLDKMSAGRPHNGYILEASPLPRLPVTSLGQLTEKDGQYGFEVTIDHQSREEAIVNGTSNFTRIHRDRSGRRPLVLLLDSIVDPGNLGGIIRTASFLGVTAIAISTRNSAPFSPVVLKASAGASENITLFSVNKPSGFIVDSKDAGWKVFAAVAPSKKQDPNMLISISTDDLDDPLSEDPCILMLGSEGEGLRWNLRSKADADLYIEGCGHSHNVDSLNVSVATGILCNSFLRKISRTKRSAPVKEEPEEVADEKPVAAGALF
jgi:21S rRNA (GM2251-2'-O)-methyltransferase